MPIIRVFVVSLLLTVLVTACVTRQDNQRAKVLCPACGTEFDAFFEKRF